MFKIVSKGEKLGLKRVKGKSLQSVENTVESYMQLWNSENDDASETPRRIMVFFRKSQDGHAVNIEYQNCKAI